MTRKVTRRHVDFDTEVREGIRIGDAISLRIIEIRGNQVRLGIDAPKNISVHREEIYELIRQQNELAARSSPNDSEVLTALWKDRQKLSKDQ